MGLTLAGGVKAQGKSGEQVTDKATSGGEKQSATTRSISLSGPWSCRLDPGHRGLSEGWLRTAVKQHTVTLPGTTQTNGIGPVFPKKLISELTPLTSYTGPAWFWRDIELSADDCSKVVELCLERCCWQTFAWLNGEALGTHDSLVAPHVYDMSSAARPGLNRLTIMVDNSNLKAKDPASAADGLQSEDLVLAIDQRKRLNCGGHHTVFGGFSWNGITGIMELLIRPQVRITGLQVYPIVGQKKIRLALTCTSNLKTPVSATVSFMVRSIHTKTPEIRTTVHLECGPGPHLSTHEITMGADMLLWDEFTPELYQLTATLETPQGVDHHTTEFGMRCLSQKGTQLAINDRPTFLRGALECFVHPITGYPPTDLDYWLKLFGVNKAHGLNHVRFHTCCPPEAAFSAADRLGLILNIELPGCSGSEPNDAATLEYLEQEALRILDTFGNHPSFCMLTMGNELLSNGEDAASQVILMKRVARCKAHDSRHFYCCTAQAHTEGRDDDYYVSAWPKGATWNNSGEPMTGIRWSGFDVVDSSRFNTRAPETSSDYRQGIAGIDKPVITHEVGQWAVYPDIKEAPKFSGVCKAFNLDIIREFMKLKGTLALADDFVKASAQLSLLLYKEEIESAMRTPGLAGFQLLGLHDHPPQGTSTIGIVTALRESKGIVTPAQFRQFCSEIVPLARLARRTFTSSEILSADIDIAHWGSADLSGAAFSWRLQAEPGKRNLEGVLPAKNISSGQLTRAGTITVNLSSFSAPAKIRLEVFLKGTEIANSWDCWVYPELSVEEKPVSRWAHAWSPQLASAVEAGDTVILELSKEHIPHATRGCFTTLFWNPIMKRNQKAFTMGVLCDPKHPALAGFPTEYHSNWQWWDILRPSRVLDLDGMQPRPESIIRMIDSFIGNRCLSVMFEARLGKGRLLVTSLDLSSDLSTRHAARQLRRSIQNYVASDMFKPSFVITASDVNRLIAVHQQKPEKETRDQIIERFDQLNRQKTEA